MLHLRRVKPALWIAAALCVALPASASASTTIGQAPPTGGASFNCSPTMGVQLAVAGGNSYAVPSGGGVITRWRSSASGNAALTVFRQSGPSHLLVAEDQRVLTGQLTSYEVRIPVVAADQIGLKMAGPVLGCLFQTIAVGDQIGVAAGAPVGTLAVLTPQAGFRFNVAADIEPDADGDGFGDETQDGCLGNPLRQDDCNPEADTGPPNTGFTKGAPDKTRKTKVKFEFISSELGSAFECKLDKEPFKACTSPKTVKRLDEGKHKFKVRAIDAAGNVDPSAATDKFKITG